MRDDALRCLQIHVRLREIFGDHGRLLLERELNGGLTGRKTFRRQAKSAAASRQLYLERPGRIGFQKQAAVRVSDGNSVIDHVAQYDVEWKLRVQQRGRFQ